MKKITFLFLFAVISVASYSQFSANLMFTARLSGDQEVPTVATEAEGVGSFILNATHDTMCVAITVKGLSGPITSIGIYQGDTGVSGPAVIPLTIINGYTVTATLTATDLTTANIANFLNGQFYVNVQTAANPGGEIRGQIKLESDLAFTALLEGTQEVPPVSGNAVGMTVIDVYRNMERADIFAQFTGLSGPVTGFSLYQGTPSVVGPILANYDTVISGNTINIEVEDSVFLNDLMAGNVYVNVLTAANPGGEIRGQLMATNKLTFDMHLDAAQETPPNTSQAMGLGTMTINGTMDTLWFDIVHDSLTSATTGAHFHVGAEGVPGPIVVDLTPSISGNHISGFVVGAPIPPDFINNALMGNIYVNVHTTNLPNGEIRGQVDRYPREGFTYMIDGGQETPPTTSLATGSGFVSLDREKENLHFEAIVNGLTGDLTASHFHSAPIGVMGPVIFPLTQLITLNDSVSVFGDWTDDDIPAFDSLIVDSLIAGKLYINFHTVQYPAGEVRGQVMQGGSCFVTVITAVATPQDELSDFVIYPVPSSDYVSVVYNAKVSSDVIISVYDISGRELSAEKFSTVAGANKAMLDVSKFNSGIYFFKIENSGKQMFYGKLIKG